MVNSEDYSAATTDEILGDVDRSPEDSELARRITAAEASRLEQANTLRSHFFNLSSLLAKITVATSAAMVLGIVFFGLEISDGVAIAFISGLAVETIGILAVMAGYLFPRPRSQIEPDTE